MKYGNLGNSGLKVSAMCLGTATFGTVGASEKNSQIILDRAIESGINFIDTADVYGHDGSSERIIGKWLEKSGRRDDVVLATKFRFRTTRGPLGVGASRRHIMQACEASLRRLDSEFIDLYQVHMQDIQVPEEETLRALDDLVRQGKVRYLGCSNYAAHRMVDSLWLSVTRNLERFVSLQAQYSLTERNIEREHIPACLKHAVGVIPWSPLAGGFLSGKYCRDESAPSGVRLEVGKQPYTHLDRDQNWSTLDAVNALASDLNATTAQVALAWLLRKPGVSSVALGVRTVKQLEENLGAVALSLSDEPMATLDEVSAIDLGYPYRMLEREEGRW